MRSENNSYSITAPEGGTIAIPSRVDPVRDPYSALLEGAAWCAYYQQHGYVVCRGLIPAALCAEARAAFAAEIKPYTGYLYRQASASPERHIFTDAGFVLNSLLNIHDLPNRLSPSFKRAGLAILTHERMQEALAALLGEKNILVQSMYFEGNPMTWAHQDTYYHDSVELGRMVGAWVAVEDIHPGAGRFYVYPGSHRIDMVKNGGDFDIAFNHARYKQLVLDIIRQQQLECRAPALQQGDVLFWSAKTIHGSLETSFPPASRSSFTAHFIPASKGFLQYQRRLKPLHLRRVNGMQVHHPKDLNLWARRAIFLLETQFPGLWQGFKRIAIKLILRRN